MWSQNYRSKVQALQMDNLRSVLGVRKINKMRNDVLRELCGVKNGVNEKINESILGWLVMWREWMEVG